MQSHRVVAAALVVVLLSATVVMSSVSKTPALVKTAFGYRLVTQSELDKTDGRFYDGAELDKKSGFFHMSAWAEVETTAAKYFANVTDLVVLKYDNAAFGDYLQWDFVPERNAYFPHIYIPKLALRKPFCVAQVPIEYDAKTGKHIFKDKDSLGSW
eukprot:TRINITY_DN6463_c0_g1_i2.p2 TRINITY_DN6463_c0_g1~~TRINITY_DN6463_c0_g1_i2.p2  ORF type:complete len:156 (-),score=95.72 TRINITY_DN6463_c0_g1_i2:122-589(-)